MKRIFYFLGLVGCCALVGKGWHIAKDGFSLNRTHAVCWRPENAVFQAKENSLDDALQQTYTYLGRGHQCYAFGSADGKYVVKLPRYDRYRLSFLLRSCPIPWLASQKAAVRADIEKRLERLLESFSIAFYELREETALLSIPPAQGPISHPLVIKDRLGRTYTLDPNRTPFILQEKKPIMMAAFQQCLQAKDRKGAEQILEAFLRVITVRAEKGIYNKDPSFLRNFGWQQGRGVQIDIGSFYRKPHLSLQEAKLQSFQETINHVRNWLAEIDTEMLAAFDQKVDVIKQSWQSGH